MIGNLEYMIYHVVAIKLFTAPPILVVVYTNPATLFAAPVSTIPIFYAGIIGCKLYVQMFCICLSLSHPPPSAPSRQVHAQALRSPVRVHAGGGLSGLGSSRGPNRHRPAPLHHPRPYGNPSPNLIVC